MTTPRWKSSRRTSRLARRTPLARKSSVKKRNAGRRQREFARAYGCKARVEWVQKQRCVGGRGRYWCAAFPCENAHVTSGGMGRKSDYRNIVPLCRKHHRALHAEGLRTFEDHYGINLAYTADITQVGWEAHCHMARLDPSTGEPRTEGATHG